MSERHRKAKHAKGSHRVSPTASDRGVSHRKSRHQTTTELHSVVKGADPDDIVDTRPSHTSRKLHPEEHAQASTPAKSGLRHWKQSFWKRRSNERLRRASQEHRGSA
jgi:hypothetical protein